MNQKPDGFSFRPVFDYLQLVIGHFVEERAMWLIGVPIQLAVRRKLEQLLNGFDLSGLLSQFAAPLRNRVQAG